VQVMVHKIKMEQVGETMMLLPHQVTVMNQQDGEIMKVQVGGMIILQKLEKM
jgi:hypothetical protein